MPPKKKPPSTDLFGRRPKKEPESHRHVTFVAHVYEFVHGARIDFDLTDDLTDVIRWQGRSGLEAAIIAALATTTVSQWDIEVTGPTAGGRGEINLYAREHSGDEPEIVHFQLRSDTGPKFDAIDVDCFFTVSGMKLRLYAGTTAIADSDLTAGHISFYLDQTNNKLKVKVKYSTGVVKTGEISLS